MGSKGRVMFDLNEPPAEDDHDNDGVLCLQPQRAVPSSITNTSEFLASSVDPRGIVNNHAFSHASSVSGFQPFVRSKGAESSRAPEEQKSAGTSTLNGASLSKSSQEHVMKAMLQPDLNSLDMQTAEKEEGEWSDAEGSADAYKNFGINDKSSISVDKAPQEKSAVELVNNSDKVVSANSAFQDNEKRNGETCNVSLLELDPDTNDRKSNSSRNSENSSRADNTMDGQEDSGQVPKQREIRGAEASHALKCANNFGKRPKIDHQKEAMLGKKRSRQTMFLDLEDVKQAGSIKSTARRQNFPAPITTRIVKESRTVPPPAEKNGEKHSQLTIKDIIQSDSTNEGNYPMESNDSKSETNADVNVAPLGRPKPECSVFKGSIEAFQVIEKQVVAIIGPQSSAIAHMISFIANGLQVPLISYAATDPTLSSLQFPFFLRTTQSDLYQMAAVADIVYFYEWKEVIAIYLDDDYGRNGIAALDDTLAKKTSKISYKLPLPINYDLSDIIYVLNQSKSLGPRVFVVHINPDPELRFFNAVHKLKMTGSDYVWLVTDWFSTSLDSFFPKNGSYLSTLEGVVGLRPYIPPTALNRAFLSRWRKLQRNELVHSGLTAYGLYAYDTVWVVARSINKLLQQGGSISFSLSNLLNGTTSDKLQLGKLRAFDGGELLMNILSQTNFTGLTGKLHFSPDRNLVGSGYEVINIVQQEIHTVGYWSNFSGLSISPPKALKHKETADTRLNQNLKIVTWPGGKSEKPRGWVIANDERPLRIGFPRRASFTEFVTLNESHQVVGYCIDLFYEARKLVPYDIPFRFEPFGTGVANPDYDQLVQMVVDDVFDAAIGDIAIVTNRTRMVDFTQPYVSTGLVIVASLDTSESSAWVFLKPFTAEMWGVTAMSFIIIAVVIWILEHRVNDDFRGPPKRQIITMFLFSFSTLFKANQENTVSTLGRMVMVVWLFLLLVITSSYTASLTSILTVQQLTSPITGIDSLITSNSFIGYQVGSFAYSYLRDSLNIAPSRLVSLRSPEEFENALRLGSGKGGVMAIVDELPYVELFLQNRTDFGIIGRPFTKSGWGFAFKKDSPLSTDMSTAILKLAESGKLQEIHEKWFCQLGCPADRRTDSEPNQLHMSSFWGLYLLCGAITLLALLIFLLRAIRQYMRYKRKHADPSSPSNTRCSQVIYSFFDFIDEKEEAIKRIFAQHDISQAQTNGS